MNEHPTLRELEAYVVGALTFDRVDAIEEHVVACAACAEALAREAQLEMALEVLAEDLAPVVMALPLPAPRKVSARPVSRARRAAPVAFGVVGALALAASAVLWLGTAHGAGSTAAPGAQLEMAADAAGSLAVMPVGSMSADALDGG